MDQQYHEASLTTLAMDEKWAHFEDACLADGFTQIPNAVMRNPAISLQARAFYGLLLSYAWQDGFCFPGQERLSKECGVSVRAVYGYIKELEEADLLHVRRRGLGKTNVYTFKSIKALTSGTDRKQTSDQEWKNAADNEYAGHKDTDLPFHRGADAPPGKGKGSGKGPGLARIASPGSERDGQPASAERLVRKLVGELGGIALDDDQRKKYGANFKTLINKDVDAAELEGAVDRIVSEWSRIQLSPQQALSDLRGNRDAGDVANPSPPEVIEAIKRDPYFGESGEMKKVAVWEIAEDWDFTSYADPPMKVRLAISPSREECDAWLRRLRSIARRAVREAQVAPISGEPAGVRGAESRSKRPEDGAEGSSTPTDRDDAHDGQGDALTEAADRITDNPDSHITDLARAVVRFPDGSITSEHVAQAVADAVDLAELGLEQNTGPMGAGALATMVIRRVQDQLSEKAVAV